MQIEEKIYEKQFPFKNNSLEQPNWGKQAVSSVLQQMLAYILALTPTQLGVQADVSVQYGASTYAAGRSGRC
jgi:hypothetical protein